MGVFVVQGSDGQELTGSRMPRGMPGWFIN